jgi:hypothetical protein
MTGTALRLLAAAALTGLGATAGLHAQQAQMSFFVTSVGKGNGADLGLERLSPRQPARPPPFGGPI